METQLTSPVSSELIEKLLVELEEKKIKRRLDYVYGQLPGMPNCDRCNKCCFVSAEVYLVEYLNILSHIRTLPKKQQSQLLRGIVSHELLNLTTTEHNCPFLEADQCSIYEYRPIACRIFGFYPENEYKASKSDSLKKNRELAGEFKDVYGMELPKDVVDHDVDQCGYNVDDNGNRVFVSQIERSKLKKLLVEIEDELVGERISDRKGHSAAFTNWYMRSHLDDQQLSNIRVGAIRAYQDGRFDDTLLENIIKQYKLEL